MKKFSVLITIVATAMLFASAASAKSFDDGSTVRYTIESAFFEITQTPGAASQGRIAVFDSFEDRVSGCSACARTFYLASDVKVRVGHEGSMMTLGEVMGLPVQPAYFVVDNNVVVKIGFSELVVESPEQDEAGGPLLVLPQ